jgi:uncharacterized protein YbjT (DUF2867 family)
MEPRTLLLAGASGLVGGSVLDLALEDPLFTRVVSVGRRALDRTHPRLTQVTVDFTSIDHAALPDVTDAIACLGTTIKKAGSQAAFRAVDHDAVLAFAKAAKTKGARRFQVVTALGADARSMVFYNRVKGEVEEALRAVGFEQRTAERIGTALANTFAPLLKPFASRPIHARTVAQAMLAIAHDPPAGARVYESGELHTLAPKG